MQKLIMFFKYLKKYFMYLKYKSIKLFFKEEENLWDFGLNKNSYT